MRVVFTLLPCLGELGMINNISDCILLLQLLFMVTLMHLEDTCTDMTWHRKAGGGDTNSMAWQAKPSWAIIAKVGVILSLKAKYCYLELSCVTLNVHSQKIIWKNWVNSDHFVIPVPLSLPSCKGPWSPRQRNNTNSLFSDALESPWRMKKFVRACKRMV